MPDVEFPVKIPEGGAPFPNPNDQNSMKVFRKLVKEKILIVALWGGTGVVKTDTLLQRLSCRYSDFFPGCTPESKSLMVEVAREEINKGEAKFIGRNYHLAVEVGTASPPTIVRVISKLSPGAVKGKSSVELRKHLEDLEEKDMKESQLAFGLSDEQMEEECRVKQRQRTEKHRKKESR